jgi:hypothetical protein
MLTTLFLQLFLTPPSTAAEALLTKTQSHVTEQQQKAAATANIAKTQLPSGKTANKITRTYTFAKWGNVQADFTEFQNVVKSTLESPKGWIRAGVTFKYVTSNQNFTIVLAEGAEIAKYSSACSATLSCRVGNYILINDTRWRESTASYLNASQSLGTYRTMVINHEVGHYLGHSHLQTPCPNPTALAPVMLQQSTGLSNCLPNPWPLASELWHRF